jgi:hypothetical protein
MTVQHSIEWSGMEPELDLPRLDAIYPPTCSSCSTVSGLMPGVGGSG